MSVISIQSQVAFGHVGNSAAVFPLQMHGIDVTRIPPLKAALRSEARC
jgi:pyridoxine kinase